MGHERIVKLQGQLIKKAGVKKSAHGLRKYAATEMAESGGTYNKLKASFGWQSDGMAEVYTRKADKKRLAAAYEKSIPAPLNIIPASKKIIVYFKFLTSQFLESYGR
tara:strand:- start:19330 stop:19650 length:321 start_codon:yes stop_codon:yes gene_type:complete